VRPCDLAVVDPDPGDHAKHAAERTLRERLEELALPCPRDLMVWTARKTAEVSR